MLKLRTLSVANGRLNHDYHTYKTLELFYSVFLKACLGLKLGDNVLHRYKAGKRRSIP